MFKNGNQTPAYGNEKRARNVIIDLQNKNAALRLDNAALRLALGKLLAICENTNMKDESETWNYRIGLAKETMHVTVPNIAKEGCSHYFASTKTGLLPCEFCGTIKGESQENINP